MLTCAFLHGDPIHLLFNCVAMYMAGAVLENLIGRRWLLGLFVIGALGGSVASLTVNPDHITSVGASGAIMALLAGAMVASLRLPKGSARTQILVSLGQILIPGLLPLATHGGNVDFGAHLGGAIAGALGGLALLVTWPRDAEHPRGGMFAAVVAVAGFVYLVFGWVQLASDHDTYKLRFAGEAVRQRNPELLKRAHSRRRAAGRRGRMGRKE
jgi:rhomboid protease GluP